MNITTTLGALAATIALMAASVAHAEGPAVSEPNGKFSLEGGATGSNSARSSGLGIAQGSFTTPLGHSFGLQLDGAAGTAYNSASGFGVVQLFWRDPQIGLLGPFAALGGNKRSTASLYGGQAEYYAGPVTLSAVGGYAVILNNTARNTGFGILNATYYPIPDLALTGGGGLRSGVGYGRASVEYQPKLNSLRNMSWFAEGRIESNSAYTITSGIRLYFGPEKPLIRRHREDDPIHVGPAVGAAFVFTGQVTGCYNWWCPKAEIEMFSDAIGEQ